MAKMEPGVDEVIKHVTILRDAWAEMLQRGSHAVDAAILARSEQPPTASILRGP